MAEKTAIPNILDNIPDYEYNDNKTNILGLIYSNKIHIMLTEAKTFGSIVHVSTDKQKLICDIQVLLGNREDDIMCLYARRLLELFRNNGYDEKTDLLLFTSIKNHSIEHLKGILRHIEENMIN